MSAQTTAATATDEDVAKTLADYERIVQATGEWNGREATEFTNDGVNWSPVWVKSEAHPHPLAARSRVHRKGVDYPAADPVMWDESLPADETWRNIWLERPRTLFGAFAARRSMRAAFREALSDRREPDDLPVARDAAPAAEPRDWDLEIATAATIEELNTVWSEARAARARTGSREVAFNFRKMVLVNERESDNWAPAEGAASPVPGGPRPKPHPPTVELRPATSPRPRIPAQHRPRNPEIAAALAAAVNDAESHGRTVGRTVRRAARAGGKP